MHGCSNRDDSISNMATRTAVLKLKLSNWNCVGNVDAIEGQLGGSIFSVDSIGVCWHVRLHCFGGKTGHVTSDTCLDSSVGKALNSDAKDWGSNPVQGGFFVLFFFFSNVIFTCSYWYLTFYVVVFLFFFLLFFLNFVYLMGLFYCSCLYLKGYLTDFNQTLHTDAE